MATKSGLDAQTAMHLRDGFTMPQLAEAYAMDIKEVRTRLARVTPSTIRGNSACYRLRDIAPYMWTPTDQQMDDAIKRMSHASLPKLLTKEYWQGRRARQDYMKIAGDLWPTERIVERVSELFKLIKQNLTLMSDVVERQTEITDRQREIIRGVTDQTLRDIRHDILKNFTPAEGETDHEMDLLQDQSVKVAEPRGEHADL